MGNEEIYSLLRQGAISQVEKALDEITEFDKNLIILAILIQIYHDEVTNGMTKTVFDYSTDISELVNHYTATKLMLRRIEFDMPSESIDDFYYYCEKNKVSSCMLVHFILVNIHNKDKVCTGLINLYRRKKGEQSMEANCFRYVKDFIREECG